MIDTTHHLETPEGIDIGINPTGPIARGLAVFIDSLIRQLVVALAAGGAAYAGAAGVGFVLIAWFLLEWFYPVVFEVLGNGQTPGKRAFGLRVINRDGTPIGWGASLIRNLLRVVDFLPFFYVTGVISMLCSRDFQRLGDLAAGTLVVGVNEPRPSGKAIEVEGTRIAPIELRPDEQRAILAFAERSSELSAERTIELANVLQLLTGKVGSECVQDLLQIANGIAGRR